MKVSFKLRVIHPAALFLIPLLCSCGNMTSNCLVAPNGLTGWWDGSGASGSGAVDLSRNLNSGTMSSSLTLASGRSSTGFSFDGTSAAITIPNSSNLSPTNALTVSAWVKGGTAARSANTFQSILSKWNYLDGSGFTQPSNWQGVDVSSFSGVATDGVTSWSGFTGGQGGLFDGRYFYINPLNGKLAQFDTQGNFTSASSWKGVNYSAFPGVATDQVTPWSSFSGGGKAFDGRYYYLISQATNRGLVARYDTTSSLTAVSSWQGVNIAAFSGTSSDGVTPWSAFMGFQAGLFDGRYVYLVPTNNGSASGKFARFDTTGSLTNPSSWQGVDVAAFSGTSTDGITPWSSFSAFTGGNSDGRYLYFQGYSGVVARYDTQSSFTSVSGWAGVKINSFSGTATDGISNWSTFGGVEGALFDGRYLYGIPWGGGTKSTIPRYDSQRTFTSSSGWQGIDFSAFSGSATDGTAWSSFKGYSSGMFDGRYLYLSPNNGSNNGKVLRFDTQGTFTTSGSWQGVNVAAFPGTTNGGSTSWSAFVESCGGGFDGRYVYFTGQFNGRVLRYDTVGNQASFQFNYSSYNYSDGMGNSLFGPAIALNVGSSSVSAQSQTELSANTWHHLAATYDGTTLIYYIDGIAMASQTGTGVINTSTSSLAIGKISGGAGYFNGLANDIQTYGKALSPSQVQSLYSAQYCR